MVKSSAKEYSIVINGGQIDRDISEPGNGNIVVNGGNISGK
jgi:hypothetical protein